MSVDESKQTPRSWLFAPGHDEKLLAKVFDAGADAVVLDLEDAVPPQLKDRARDLVARAASEKSCWVRVSRPLSDECRRDIAALAGVAKGLRLPKVEAASDVEWVAHLAPGVALDCTIESARGLLAAVAIASHPACTSLADGGRDFVADLGIAGGEQETLFARSFLVVACRAAEKPPPSDGVHVLIDDDDGLRREAAAARRLGFFGKSAIHPRQVPIINEVFATTVAEVAWAERVTAAFGAGGRAATEPGGG